MKIHILGPSGSGTTTVGIELSRKYSIQHFDSDDFFWLPTDPPFQTKRPLLDRIQLLREKLSLHDSWILSGSVLKWGDFLREEANIIIQLYLEKDIRIQRLKKREFERYGNRILSGNDLYETHIAFIKWAESYETGGLDMRSKQSEDLWVSRAHCNVIKISTNLKLCDLIYMIDSKLKEISNDFR